VVMEISSQINSAIDPTGLLFIKRSTVKIADARAHHQKAKMPGLEALHSLVIYLHFEWFD